MCVSRPECGRGPRHGKEAVLTRDSVQHPTHHPWRRWNLSRPHASRCQLAAQPAAHSVCLPASQRVRSVWRGGAVLRTFHSRPDDLVFMLGIMCRHRRRHMHYKGASSTRGVPSHRAGQLCLHQRQGAGGMRCPECAQGRRFRCILQTAHRSSDTVPFRQQQLHNVCGNVAGCAGDEHQGLLCGLHDSQRDSLLLLCIFAELGG